MISSILFLVILSIVILSVVLFYIKKRNDKKSLALERIQIREYGRKINEKTRSRNRWYLEVIRLSLWKLLNIKIDFIKVSIIFIN